MSLAFVRRIDQQLVNSPHKWPVTRKMFPFDDIIMVADKNFHNISANVEIVIWNNDVKNKKSYKGKIKKKKISQNLKQYM